MNKLRRAVVDQLQRGERQRRGAIALRFGQPIEDAFGVSKDLLVYFGQKRCAYCHKLMNENFGLANVVDHTKRHFDIVPIDIWGVEEVTDLNGEVLTERDFALCEGTKFMRR